MDVDLDIEDFALESDLKKEWWPPHPARDYFVGVARTRRRLAMDSSCRVGES